MPETRFIRLILCAATIATGLSLRRFGYDLGLPFGLVKYGGSVLWGTMMYFLVGLAQRSRPGMALGMMALGIAIAVEFSRLYHAPALDAFRLTTPGALLLGRVFSLWNIAAYAVGIAIGLAVDIAFAKAPPKPVRASPT